MEIEGRGGEEGMGEGCGCCCIGGRVGVLSSLLFGFY